MTTPSHYGTMLPELFHEGATREAPSSADRLIKIIETLFGDFEETLGKAHGFEKRLDAISDYFDPLKTDPDFLPWMASWVSLVLRADWTVEQQRDVLAKIIPLYRKRGTREGLEEYLAIYAGEGVTIRDELEFQIGGHSQLGVDTVIGGHIPAFRVGVNSTVDAQTVILGGLSLYDYFLVTVPFSEADANKIKKRLGDVEAVLEIEKPAHTFCKVIPWIPALRIGVHSTIGKDTFI